MSDGDLCWTVLYLGVIGVIVLGLSLLQDHLSWKAQQRRWRSRPWH